MSGQSGTPSVTYLSTFYPKGWTINLTRDEIYLYNYWNNQSHLFPSFPDLKAWTAWFALRYFLLQSCSSKALLWTVQAIKTMKWDTGSYLPHSWSPGPQFPFWLHLLLLSNLLYVDLSQPVPVMGWSQGRGEGGGRWEAGAGKLFAPSAWLRTPGPDINSAPRHLRYTPPCFRLTPAVARD